MTAPGSRSRGSFPARRALSARRSSPPHGVLRPTQPRSRANSSGSRATRITTKPNCPRQNGKTERFRRTTQEYWADRVPRAPSHRSDPAHGPTADLVKHGTADAVSGRFAIAHRTPTGRRFESMSEANPMESAHDDLRRNCPRCLGPSQTGRRILGEEAASGGPTGSVEPPPGVQVRPIRATRVRPTTECR
jgi:hypothetical protein